MYKEESETELIFLAIFMIALIPVGAVVNGLMLAYAWAELLLPIFPQLPAINQWQAIGISTFVGMFMLHLAKAETKTDKKTTVKSIIVGIFVQWILYFAMIWLVSLTY